MPRKVPLVAANSPVSRRVGRTSARQLGWRFVHAGKIREPPACQAGGGPQENCVSQSWVFSVNSAAIACGSRQDKLVKVHSRVLTFNRRSALSRPPPSSADKLVMVRFGARQDPAHSTVRAINCPDSKSAS